MRAMSAAVLLLFAWAGEVAALDTVKVTIKEYEVPWTDSRPRDPAVDARGQIWFVGQRGHYLARLDPPTGKFSRFELDPGTGPHNVVLDRDGNPW